MVCKVQRLFVTRPIPGFYRISVERQAHQLIGMLLMLGDLGLIVETDPENAFTRRMRKGLGGGATVRRCPTGELPTSASGTSERPIPLGLCLKCRVIRKNADRTSSATVRELPASRSRLTGFDDFSVPMPNPSCSCETHA